MRDLRSRMHFAQTLIYTLLSDQSLKYFVYYINYVWDKKLYAIHKSLDDFGNIR